METEENRPIIRLVATALTVLAVAACATSLPLEERFRQVAVYDEEAGEEWPILKRSKGIRLWVNGANDADMRQIRAVSRQITEATGLQVAPVDQWSTPNVRIAFVDDQTWQRLKDRDLAQRSASGLSNQGYDPQCAVNFFDGPAGDPLAIIMIPDSSARALRDACIAQELAHSTGLAFDTNGRSDTVFGDWAGASELTPVDYQLLRILYDPRLRSGMTWAEARPIVRQIISEMETSP